ncbi:hypothetical protein FN846DRAFT_912674 [Sphaerosporella brunnea]|uniref:Uncharacterized protein n=1 Tax=Sphaerosporella brunnea TaxID=1250544 RepID=A0A5J5EHP3_9PEZI|nr:hypothetical protein FN846DRAFT_912674 [Sphaerosporella brunnea]
MARRQYEEKQQAHEAAMRAQQQTPADSYTQQADPAVEDLGARFAGFGYPTQRDIDEQRLEQERIRRLRAQQDAGNDLHRQMGGSGWGGGGAWGGGRGAAWSGDRAFGGSSGGLGGGWGPRMDQPRPMRFPDSEASVNMTEWMVKHRLRMNDVPCFYGQIGLENLRKWQMDGEHFAKIAGLSENGDNQPRLDQIWPIRAGMVSLCGVEGLRYCLPPPAPVSVFLGGSESQDDGCFRIRVSQYPRMEAANEKRQSQTFREGDRVMIKTATLPLTYGNAAAGDGEARLSRTLPQRYIGPYTLGNLVGENAFRIVDLPDYLRKHRAKELVREYVAAKADEDLTAAIPRAYRPINEKRKRQEKQRREGTRRSARLQEARAFMVEIGLAEEAEERKTSDCV